MCEEIAALAARGMWEDASSSAAAALERLGSPSREHLQGVDAALARWLTWVVAKGAWDGGRVLECAKAMEDAASLHIALELRTSQLHAASDSGGARCDDVSGDLHASRPVGSVGISGEERGSGVEAAEGWRTDVHRQVEDAAQVRGPTLFQRCGSMHTCGPSGPDALSARAVCGVSCRAPNVQLPALRCPAPAPPPRFIGRSRDLAQDCSLRMSVSIARLRRGMLLGHGEEAQRLARDVARERPEERVGPAALAVLEQAPPPSLLLPLPMSLLYTPSVDNSSSRP